MSDEQTLEQEKSEVTEEQQEAESVDTVELSAEQELQQKLEAAEAKAAESIDQLLRTKADMENLRRRTQRDLESAHKFALEKFAQELLAVKDSLELGVQAASQEGADVEKLREGTELTANMLSNVFEKFNLEEVNPLNEPFDADLHQAMTMQENPEVEPNTVMAVMQKGYKLNDRLIRPAMVVVSKAAKEKSE